MQKENATVLSCLDAIRSELRCGICLSTLRDPKITNCQHMYCKQCLYDYMSTRREKKDRFCPLCKTTLDLRQCTEGDYASTLVQNYLELAKKFLREVRNPCFSIPKEKAFLESQAVFDPASVASPVRTFQVPLPILQVKQKPTRAKRGHVLQFSTINEAENEESSDAANIEKELKSPVVKKTRLESVTLTETKFDKLKDQEEQSTSIIPNASKNSTVGGMEQVDAPARIPSVSKAVQTEDVEEIELLKTINIEALIQYHQEHHRVSALAALLFLLPPLERLLKESKDDVLELIGVREAEAEAPNSASDVDAHDETLPCYENVPAASHEGEERVENGNGEKVTSRSSSIVPDSDGEGIGGMDSFYDDDATMIVAPGEDTALVLPNSQSRRALEELQELIEKEEAESPRKPVTISTHESLGSFGIQLPSKINDPIPFDENGKLIEENRLARLLTPRNSRNLDSSGSTLGRRTMDSPAHGIHVAFAGIDSLNKEWAVTEFRFKFGAKLKFTKDVLHKANYVVYMNDENGIIPHRVRSLIYVSAVAAGVPIVGGAWVRNCLKHGKLFNPNHYLEKTDSPVQLPPSARSKNGEKLFAGYRFSFPEKYSDSNFVTRNELIDIAKLAGAEVVEDMNSLTLLDQEKDKIIFAVGSAECHVAKRMEMEFACTVLMGDWILDSLKYFKVVPKVDKYRVSQRMPSFKRPLVEISQKTSSNVKKEKRKQIPVPVQEDSSSISIF